MTNFKKQKLNQFVKNIDSLPAGELKMNNPFLNKRLSNIQTEENQAIDTSLESLYLLRNIVINANASLNGGVSLRGIIQLGQFLRTRGNKVDFLKLDKWLNQLHLRRMAQLQGSILIKFFNFDADELPFIHHIEGGATNITLQSLSFNYSDSKDEIEFKQSKFGIVKPSSASLRKNIRLSMRFFNYAPIETLSYFFNNFAHSLSEIEE